MAMRASRTLAFATGTAVAIPALVALNLSMDVLFTRFLVIIVWLSYIAAIFFFVFGPQYWDTYRWIPADGTFAVMGRAVAWILGGLLSIALLEATSAI